MMGMAAAARVGRTTLILVHTHDLATQWAERIRQSLGVEAGMIGGGKHDVQPITIAMLQTLARMPETDVVLLGKRFGVLICDEVHHLPAATMSRAVNALSCRYRWGLSATPEREDGLHFMLEWVLGPTLHTIQQAELIAAGHLMAAEVVTVPYYRTLDWVDLSDRYQASRQAAYEQLRSKSERLDKELRRLDAGGEVAPVEGEGEGEGEDQVEEEAPRLEASDFTELHESPPRSPEGEGEGEDAPVEFSHTPAGREFFGFDGNPDAGDEECSAAKIEAPLVAGDEAVAVVGVQTGAAASCCSAANEVKLQARRSHLEQRLEAARRDAAALYKGLTQGYRWDGERGQMPGWAMDALYWHIQTDPDRNRLLADLVELELKREGGTVLVLTLRKAHCAELARVLEARGVRSEVLTAAKTKKLRKGALDELRSGELRCVVATQLADEGLDLPRLTGVILAMPSRAKGRTEQRLGRVMRPAPGKPTPRLYDVQDESVGIFRSQARRRMQAFRKVLGEIKPRVLDLRQREMR
jgi:superfamily II DNA or RNA helicase